MVLPARPAAALVVIDPEFLLEIFVQAFGGPAALQCAHQSATGPGRWQGAQEEVLRMRFAVAPLHHKPDRIPLAMGDLRGIGDANAVHMKPRRESSMGA